MLSVNNHLIDEKTIEIEFNRLMRVGVKRIAPDEAQKQTAAFRLQAKDHAINRRLLLEEAVRRKINVSEQAVEIFLKQMTGQGRSESGFAGRLENYAADVRENIRNACRIESLVKTVIISVPEPARDEVLKYLNDSDIAPAGKNHDAELTEKLIEKTRRLAHRLRQNQILTDFIAELRKKAVIIES